MSLRFMPPDNIRAGVLLFPTSRDVLDGDPLAQ